MFKFFIQSLSLVVAYWVVGLLALMLAIPPGFATAIFPPIGIAIGAVLLVGVRLLPAVFLGSLALNLTVSFQSNQTLTTEGGLLASGIALGTTLAVSVAHALSRVILKERQAFTREGEIATLLLATGPIACVLSASFCTAALYAAGVVGLGSLGVTWWTWWIGDSIGVMLALPLMYVAFGKPADVWRKRALHVGLPIVIATSLMTLVFVRINTAELDRLEKAFNQLSVPFAANFNSALAGQLGVLRSIDGLLQASQDVTEQDFAVFTQDVLETNPAFYALSWNAYIAHPERAKEERALAARGLPAMIRERSEEGVLVGAGQHSDYIFVKYIEPKVGNEMAQSFNVGSIANRREALVRSANTGEAVMTSPIQLVQDTVQRKALLIFYPVYKKGVSRQQLSATQGFATAVVVMEELINKLISDYGTSPGFTVAVDYVGNQQENLATLDSAKLSQLAPLLRFEQTYPFAGAALKITLEPTDTFITKHKSTLTWTVLAGGFLFCALLGGFLLSLSVRSERIGELVDERTAELSSILNSATDVILTVDANGVIHRHNQSAVTLFSTTDATISGSHIDEWLEAFAREKVTISRFFDEHNNTVFDTTLITQNGERVAVEVGISSVELSQGSYYVVMLHDITERKKTEKLKSEFISTVSHELRTPLTSIVGSLKLVEAGVTGEISAKAKSMITIARNNTERLNALVNDILDVEKLEFDQLKIAISDVPLVSIVKQVVQQVEGFADGFGVTLELSWQEHVTDATCIRADAHRLTQVIVNILSNAIKYSNKGASVIVSVGVEGKHAVIAVRDSGRGMPEYFRKQIFQKFSQADSTDTREKSGTGLGLYIAKSLTEKMQGSISFESELGKGSEFFISLPLAEPNNS
ncbi:CHASE domain-containing protein [Gilvimarinus sp. SDUM040013]|uniref:histidine kinase n=1 Tax=Gilvimarinus gilvus TaxID=3058038 RepID=A0ABU4RXI7_9GAMM|nr:CHASE domain-containing protein [Gilvimarinus sp. SDUM040013]MDO3387698.1 CHASE domain-containing protein [Gilvimarinus sp. SDUM040013]MDX6848861.1 CHASE domain-containing protein [Gilvimarinus sp. SDUM040013]